MTPSVTTLFRPVGQKEYDLIASVGFREFPQRLPWQPIFYPVLSVEYAIEIARDWNTKDAENGCVGYVTEFDVDSDYAKRFPVKQVGASGHRELWVPSGELSDFNRKISGLIRIVRAFRRGQTGGIEEFTPPGPP